MSLALLPLKLLGWTAAGAALAVGWKLGSYLVDAASGSEEMKNVKDWFSTAECSGPEPLWKRKFTPFSET